MTEPQSPSFYSILPLYIVIFIGFLGYSLMIAILTPMILEDSGGILSSLPFKVHRTIVLGALLALYPAGQFFGSPILGALSDRYGRRPIIITSLFVITVCYALIAFSLEIKNLPLLALVSLVAGIADADIVTAQSAIADVSTEDNRSRYFGYIYLSVSAAYVIGPLFGGKLADPSIVPWFGYSTPYWAVFILLIPTLIMTFMVFRETRPKEKKTEVSYFKAFTNLTTVFTAKRIRIIYLVNFLIYFAIFGFFRSYPMYLVDEFKMGVGRVSEFIAWVAVPIILANLWITGFLSRHYSPRSITIVSTILFGVFTSVIVIPRAEDALWVTLFLTSLPLAVALPACASMLSLMVSADEQGGVLGNNQSLQVGAEAFSGFAAGLLAAVFFELPMIVLSVIAVLSALILIASGSGRARS